MEIALLYIFFVTCLNMKTHAGHGFWEKIHFLVNKKERIVKYLIIKILLQYDVDKEIQGLLSSASRIEEKIFLCFDNFLAMRYTGYINQL